MCLHDDGNLCIYNSESPHKETNIWCSGPKDPIKDIEISSIEYDLEKAKIIKTGDQNLYQQTVKNDASEEQTSTIKGEESVEETRSWSNAIGAKVGVETEISAGIPFVAEGKIKVSAEISDTITWGRSKTTKKVWGFDTAVKVPTHKSITVLIVAKSSTIAVPYTVTETVILTSGRKIPGCKCTGIYTGSNAHDLTVTYIDQHPESGELSITSRAI